jgi:hypothetical protein
MTLLVSLYVAQRSEALRACVEPSTLEVFPYDSKIHPTSS